MSELEHLRDLMITTLKWCEKMIATQGKADNVQWGKAYDSTLLPGFETVSAEAEIRKVLEAQRAKPTPRLKPVFEVGDRVKVINMPTAGGPGGVTLTGRTGKIVEVYCGMPGAKQMYYVELEADFGWPEPVNERWRGWLPQDNLYSEAPAANKPMSMYFRKTPLPTVFKPGDDVFVLKPEELVGVRGAIDSQIDDGWYAVRFCGGDYSYAIRAEDIRHDESY